MPYLDFFFFLSHIIGFHCVIQIEKFDNLIEKVKIPPV